MSDPKTFESQEIKPTREIDEQTQKHIDRFLQGKEVWNRWANEMLAKKEALEKAGKWKVKLNEGGKIQDRIITADTSIPEIENWIKEANVDFSDLIFQIDNISFKNEERHQGTLKTNFISVKSFFPIGDSLDFSGFIFPGKAFFLNSKFDSKIDFRDVIFKSTAFFSETIFYDVAFFRNAVFEAGSDFINAKFFAVTNFSEVDFFDFSCFRYAEFNGFTYFSNVVFNDEANFDTVKFLSHAFFNETVFREVAIFNACQFQKLSNFQRANFEKSVCFNDARFESIANFSETKFYDSSEFNDVEFSEFVNCYGAIFKGTSDFSVAKFNSNVDFWGARFIGASIFTEVDFKSRINFNNTKFENRADFEAIQSKRAFNLAAAKFTSNIPNFTQANFTESPRLDHVTVLPSPRYKKYNLLQKKVFGVYNWQKYFWDKKFLPYLKSIFLRAVNRASPITYSTIVYFSKRTSHFWNKFTNNRRKPDEEAHYRALKRLAIQAHDHENEMKFFAGEIRARRHVTDFANFLTHDFASSMRYWAGVAYELFSDFGRSFIRPALWWFACLWLFANLTLSGAGLHDKSKCHNSQLTPKEAAYTIGLKNSLLILGLTKTNIVKQAELCLYGVNKNGEVDKETKPYDPKIKRAYQAKPTKADTTKTDIPFKAAVQGITHSGLSLLFLFLLLLAIRNQFKIK